MKSRYWRIGARKRGAGGRTGAPAVPRCRRGIVAFCGHNAIRRTCRSRSTNAARQRRVALRVSGAPPRQPESMHQPSQFDLLRERRFAPFFWTQFLGAANDNVYKNALVIFVAFHAATLTSLDPNALVNVAGAVFIAPFVLFSATVGAARRQVREVAAHPLDQALRDRDHGDRPRRLLAARSRAAVRRAGADGRAFDAVRPGQVRDPPAAPEARGADRRQRPGRDGDVRRDPARHDRRRPRRRDRRRRTGDRRGGRDGHRAGRVRR